MKDLREKYAKCDLIVSDPVVGFKETIVLSDTKTGGKCEAEAVTVTTSSKVHCSHIQNSGFVVVIAAHTTVYEWYDTVDM